jgi:hypothetical protein
MRDPVDNMYKIADWFFLSKITSFQLNHMDQHMTSTPTRISFLYNALEYPVTKYTCEQYFLVVLDQKLAQVFAIQT